MAKESEGNTPAMQINELFHLHEWHGIQWFSNWGWDFISGGLQDARNLRIWHWAPYCSPPEMKVGFCEWKVKRKLSAAAGLSYCWPRCLWRHLTAWRPTCSPPAWLPCQPALTAGINCSWWSNPRVTDAQTGGTSKQSSLRSDCRMASSVSLPCIASCLDATLFALSGCSVRSGCSFSSLGHPRLSQGGRLPLLATSAG